MAKKPDRDILKQSLKDLLARQIAPASAYRLVQLAGGQDPLKKLNARELDKLAHEMAGQSEGIKKTIQGHLTLYSLSDEFLAHGTASRFENRLESISPGLEHAQDFEHWCADLLRETFGNTLSFLPEQSRTDGGRQRLDIYAAIQPGHAFWDRLQSDYHSRYIVFECKNSEDAPAPEHIIQAADYLSPSARRMICILVCRNALVSPGPAFDRAESRNRAEKKLVLGISTDDLLSMARSKETGQDPCTLLNQRLDTFLRESKP